MQSALSGDYGRDTHISGFITRSVEQLMSRCSDADCFRTEPDGGVSIDVRRLAGHDSAPDFSYQLDPMPTDSDLMRHVKRLLGKPWMTIERLGLFIAAAEKGRRVSADR